MPRTKKSVMEKMLDEIYEISNPPPIELFKAWLDMYFELERAMIEKEMQVAETVEDLKNIYKKYTGEGSAIRKIEKAIAEAYKKDRENGQI